MSIAATNLIARNDILLRMLNALLQHISVHRTISINAKLLNHERIDVGPFAGYLQILTAEAIAIYVCKIFESPNKRYKLNSIPSILSDLSDCTLQELRDEDWKRFLRSANSNSDVPPTAQSCSAICTSALESFGPELERFKTFRDKIGAHSEAGVSISDLPSSDVSEKLFRFGMAFYRLVRSMHGGRGPENASSSANPAFVRLLNAAGFQGIKMRYEEDGN